MKGVGGVMQGISEMRAQQEQARILREQGSWERGRAAFEAAGYRGKVSRSLAKDAVKRSASGIEPDSGSAALVDQYAFQEGEVNAEQLIREGEVRAYRYEQEATLRERKGKNDLWSGMAGAGMASLTAASTLAKYAKDGPKTKADIIGSKGKGVKAKYDLGPGWWE